MRVLVSTTAGSGHFGPLIPFARACVEAGHDVRVAAPESFAPQVASAGFEHAPFDDVPADVMGAVFGRVPHLPADEAEKVVLAEIFGRLDAQAALPGLVRHMADWRPDLVLREPAEFGSLAAAVSAGIPHVTVAIGLRAMLESILDRVVEPLAELDALAGLEQGACEAAQRAAPLVSSVPGGRDHLDGESSGATYRFFDAGLVTGTDRSRPSPWADPEWPMVYVTFGSVAAAQERFRGIYPAVLDALADHEYRVLLTTGNGIEPGSLGAVPANARVERWWPQADLMPHAAAMVGHGGFGTTMGALAFGVPQVVVPLFSFDQKVNADWVAAMGAGRRVEADALDQLPKAIGDLLADPSYAAAAQAVAREMSALRPLEESVELFESWASEVTPGRP